MDNTPHILNTEGVQYHIDRDIKQTFILIKKRMSSTPSGLEFSLDHNPELALGANHIQALRAYVDQVFLLDGDPWS